MTAESQSVAPDVETSSEDYAKRFSGKAGDYMLSVQRRAILDSLRGVRCQTALDVGGGHGQLVPILLDLGVQTTVFGSEPGCHHRVRRGFSDRGVEYAAGDLLRLPFPDQSFDLVAAVRLVSHVELWDCLLAELCRVARLCVLLDYPAVRSLNALTPLLFGLKKRLEGNTRTYISFRRGQLRRVLAENLFSVTKETPQFLLPMVAHRALHGAGYLQAIENGFRAVQLTRALGSPVILRADRVT